jgi:hypothetical protein
MHFSDLASISPSHVPCGFPSLLLQGNFPSAPSVCPPDTPVQLHRAFLIIRAWFSEQQHWGVSWGGWLRWVFLGPVSEWYFPNLVRLVSVTFEFRPSLLLSSPELSLVCFCWSISPLPPALFNVIWHVFHHYSSICFLNGPSPHCLLSKQRKTTSTLKFTIISTGAYCLCYRPRSLCVCHLFLLIHIQSVPLKLCLLILLCCSFCRDDSQERLDVRRGFPLPLPYPPHINNHLSTTGL